MSTEQSVPSIPRLGTRAATLLFLLALAVRLAATAVVGFSTLQFGDARAYLFPPRTLPQTRRFPERTGPPFFPPPPHPPFLFLSTVRPPDRAPPPQAAPS